MVSPRCRTVQRLPRPWERYPTTLTNATQQSPIGMVCQETLSFRTATGTLQLWSISIVSL